MDDFVIILLTFYIGLIALCCWALWHRLRGRYYAGLNKTARRYFRGKLSDAEYDKFAKSNVGSQQRLRQVAMSKFDLDESELNELPPVCLTGYCFDEKIQSILAKEGKDRKWRSSVYQVSWLFFSTEKVCVYQYTLNFRRNEEKRVTKEYFWKEIVAFNTVDGVQITGVKMGAKKIIISPAMLRKNGNDAVPLPKTLNVKQFSLVVPSNQIDCAMPNDDSFDKTLRGMKATLKMKKEG